MLGLEPASLFSFLHQSLVNTRHMSGDNFTQFPDSIKKNILLVVGKRYTDTVLILSGRRTAAGKNKTKM